MISLGAGRIAYPFEARSMCVAWASGARSMCVAWASGARSRRIACPLETLASAWARCAALLLGLAGGVGCDAGPEASLEGRVVRVAVAGNFAGTLERLGEAFAVERGGRVEASAGSTGKLYAQIVQGAPFDVFLAADAERPERLVANGRADPASLRRYARGRLAVVAHPRRAGDGGASNGREPPSCLDALLLTGQARSVAIANPETAPYGRAAEQVLRTLGRWAALESAVARGENVAQVLHFVASGNADLGFVAVAQANAYRGDALAGCRWHVPPALHAPIEQKMVLVGSAGERDEVKAFARFMAGPTAARIIREAGYGL